MAQGVTGQRGNPADQRLAENDRVVDRNHGADVLADHTDIRRQAATGHFLAGQNLDQLLFAAGGVLGRKHHHLHGFIANCLAHGSDGLGLVVLDANQHLNRLEDVHENLDTRHHFRRLVAHGGIVCGDIRLALGAIDDQGMNLLFGTRLELDCRRKPRAAQAIDAGHADDLEQWRRIELAVVGNWLQVGPLVLAIAFQGDRPLFQTRCMGERRRANGGDGAGGGRVQWAADHAVRLGDHLALEHAVAHGHQRLGPGADMLQQRQDQTLGQRWCFQTVLYGLVLVLLGVNAAVDIPDTNRLLHHRAPRSVAITPCGGRG